MRMPTLMRYAVAISVLAGVGLIAPAWGDVAGLEVSVTTQPARLHSYVWTVDDVCDQTELFLAAGEQGVVDHTVTCDATFTDGGYHVTGEVTVTNNTGALVTITGLSILVMPDIEGTVECGVVFPYDLEVGETLTCNYLAQLPCTMTRNVWATVTTTAGEQQGMGVSDFASGVIEDVDERIDLDDSLAGSLGFCLASEAPVQIEYSAEIGPFAEPGDWPIVNTVTFTTDDTLTVGGDECSVLVHVAEGEEEEEGCTFTFGYWKNHSEFGPAPFDCTWDEFPEGAGTEFFLSGQSYYEVLWTPPRRGNAYYILAHQYIAAELNMLSGASAPDEVLDAFDEAAELFEEYTPEEIGELRGGSGVRTLFLCLADTLGRYNEGEIGPGPCDDEECGDDEGEGGCGDEVAPTGQADRHPTENHARGRALGPSRRGRL